MKNSTLDYNLKKRKEQLDDDIQKCNMRFDKAEEEYKKEISEANGKNVKGSVGAILLVVFCLVPLLFLVICSITCFTNCDGWLEVDSNMLNLCESIAGGIGTIIIGIIVIRMVLKLGTKPEREEAIRQLEENREKEINSLNEKYNRDIIKIKEDYNITVERLKRLKKKYETSSNTELVLEILYNEAAPDNRMQNLASYVRFREYLFCFRIETEQIWLSTRDGGFSNLPFRPLRIRELKNNEECEVLAEVLVHRLCRRIREEFPEAECDYKKVAYNEYQIFYKAPNDNYEGTKAW